jgi:hypothetical protein
VRIVKMDPEVERPAPPADVPKEGA